MSKSVVKLYKCGRALKPSWYQKPELPCSTLLVVTTDDELQALRQIAHLPEHGGVWTPFKGKRGAQYYYMGNLGTFFNVCALKIKNMGSISYDGSSATILRASVELKTNSIIMMGMGFGIDKHTQKLGDIFISTSIIPYDRNRKYVDRKINYFKNKSLNKIAQLTDTYIKKRQLEISENYIFKYEDNRPQHNANQKLLNILDQGRKSWIESKRTPSIHMGIVLSGEAKIHSEFYKNKIIKELNLAPSKAIVGGDMESVGLLMHSPRKEPSWIVVKAISDFADNNRNHVISGTRFTACYNSAMFVISSLVNYKPRARRIK